MKPNIKNLTFSKDISIRSGLAALEKETAKIIFLVNDDNRLVGTCTDGDFRRAILNSVDINDPVEVIANLNPITVPTSMQASEAQSLLRKHNILYAPVVDDEGYILDMVSFRGLPKGADKDIPIVLMAGGLGRRLMPLTENCPKPLLPLGDKPILEHIILRFKEQGFRRFYISINYLGHMIEDYFGTGDYLDVKISYLKETKRLGTGGALGLLPKNMTSPFIVMNGDLLTEMDFSTLLDTHESNKAAATMCIREYITSIPFGVVETDHQKYISTQEKPTLIHHINAGVYCLSSEALRYIPHNEFYDMPTLFADLTEEKKPCAVHLIHDTWIDVGSTKEYHTAQARFAAT